MLRLELVCAVCDTIEVVSAHSCTQLANPSPNLWGYCFRYHLHSARQKTKCFLILSKDLLFQSYFTTTLSEFVHVITCNFKPYSLLGRCLITSQDVFPIPSGFVPWAKIAVQSRPYLQYVCTHFLPRVLLMCSGLFALSDCHAPHP